MSVSHTEYMRQWRPLNRDKIKVVNARHYQKHKEEHDTVTRAWALAHPVRRREIERQSRAKHVVKKAKYRRNMKEYLRQLREIIR